MRRHIILSLILIFGMVLSVAGINPVLADKKILVLTGNRTNAEFPVLSKFTKVGSEKIEYTDTKDKNLPQVSGFDILWIGQGEICENAYFFNKDIETTIKDYVKNGGVVISVGQDSDGGRPCEAGWLAAPVVGIERGGVETFTITKEGENSPLFTEPNDLVKSPRAHFDDAWMSPDKAYKVLATIGPGDIGFATLEHGKGVYILTSIENENAGDVATNTLAMENLVHFAVLLITSRPVESVDKLTTIWGDIKRR
ncbi:MAG: hypothetical protein ACE5PV_15125 [Candidatus Poribacteria bacterium]